MAAGTSYDDNAPSTTDDSGWSVEVTRFSRGRVPSLRSAMNGVLELERVFVGVPGGDETQLELVVVQAQREGISTPTFGSPSRDAPTVAGKQDRLNHQLAEMT